MIILKRLEFLKYSPIYNQKNERIKKFSNSSNDATKIRPPFPERLRKVDKMLELD